MSNVSRKINQRLLWPVTTMVREISSIWTISCHYNSLLHNNSLSLTTLDHNWGSTRKEHKEDNLNIELILEWLLSEPESRPISSNKSHTHGISHRDQIILHTCNQTFVSLKDHVYRMWKVKYSNIWPNQTIVSDQSELTILLCQPMIIYVGY